MVSVKSYDIDNHPEKCTQKT